MSDRMTTRELWNKVKEYRRWGGDCMIDADSEAIALLDEQRSAQDGTILDRLRHLTPGGSEFQTADECFEWIKRKLSLKPFSLKRPVGDARVAEALEALEKAKVLLEKRGYDYAATACINDALSALSSSEQGETPEGHGEPCYYCGKPCNSYAGNPREWPVALCHSDDPGKVKWHHAGCISERLNLLEILKTGESTIHPGAQTTSTDSDVTTIEVMLASEEALHRVWDDPAAPAPEKGEAPLVDLRPFNVALALRLSRLVHDACPDAPHDIGVTLAREIAPAQPAPMPFDVRVDITMPDAEIRAEANGKEVGRIVNIAAPMPDKGEDLAMNPPDVCTWSQDSDGCWNGTCGIQWWLESATPSENDMHYCPKCGKPLIEKPYAEQEEETE